MLTRQKLFIGGDWVEPASSETISVISPVTEEQLAEVPAGSTKDIDRAVAAAREAFDTGVWPRLAAAERADVLSALSAALSARQDLLARTITEENGCPISFSLPGQVLGGVMLVDYFSGLARDYPFEAERSGLMGSQCLVRQEPVGVVGAIVPWNAPLVLTLLKLAPALAAGCTVVVKPAPETPLDAYILAECLQEAGVPDGVVNIVAADRKAGEHLVTHPAVDKITFTGSTAAGRRIAALCGEDLRRVTLELGGKSAAIICDDADLSSALPILVGASTAINGQGCSNQTRILVSRRRRDELIDGLSDAYKSLPVGDPLDPSTAIGPLVSERQRARVEGYITSGREEGAKIATGGGRPTHLPKGWFVEPTVFVDVDNHMRIAQEEIFGPVAVVIAYEDTADAVRLANESAYGLSGSVWSADVNQAVDIARQVRTGTLTINGFMFEMNCPFGGFKASGIGREMGPEGLAAYLEHKTITVPGQPAGIFG